MKKSIWILHGWAQGPKNETKWQPFFDALEKTGIQVNFLTIPGLDSPLEEVWTLDQYVDWLAKAVPTKPVVLLGHSFGGQLAVRFAALYPERVAQLVLIAPAGILDRSLQAQLKRTVFKAAAKVGKTLTRSQQARRVLYKLAREQDYFKANPTLRQTMSKILGQEIIADIPKIKAKTLLIWGEQDRATPYKHHSHYLEAGIELVFEPMQDARHAPQFTHPQQTAKLVSSFYQEKKS